MTAPIALAITALLVGVTIARVPGPPIFSAIQHYPEICYLPPDSGLCDGDKAPLADNTVEFSNGGTSGDMQTHFYFDTTTEQCYQFSTQNCGGNKNRFTSLAECQAHCRLVT